MKRNSDDIPKVWDIGRVPKPVTEEWLNEAYSKGMLRKDQLEDGKYYLGNCRNASVARWDAKKDCFTYMRSKFRDVFPEDINYPSDDDGFDLFVPIEEVAPYPDEEVPIE